MLDCTIMSCEGKRKNLLHKKKGYLAGLYLNEFFLLAPAEASVLPPPDATSSMLCPRLLYLPPDATNPGQGLYAFIGHQPKPGTVAMPPCILPSPLHPLSISSFPQALHPLLMENATENKLVLSHIVDTTIIITEGRHRQNRTQMLTYKVKMT